MIKVTIYRSVDNGIVSFQVSGHANYADHGQDIVCAGVSAVTVGTVNAIDMLCKIPAEKNCKMVSGFVHFTLPTKVERASYDKAQILLEGMVVSLQSIELSYGKFITIKEKTQEV
jgi:uncharacterized protein YsxB (DUF464 family)